MRASGILLPIFSLPSPYGYGDLGEEAYKFIDRLQEAGQRYWQVLPIGPINREFCPYQSSSSFAGEPLLLSLQKLAEQGLLTDDDLAAGDAQITEKKKVLRTAFRNFRSKLQEDDQASLHYKAFCKMEEHWIDDYALFSALTDYYGDGDWSCWDKEIREHQPSAVAQWAVKLSYEVEFYRWMQYEFFNQWDALKKYAHEKGVELIGDIPYYAAYESADCWANPGFFQLDEAGKPAFEAGAPPDAFTAEGQCWGNPVYDWEAQKRQGYRWFVDRIGQQLRFFDVVRIDHMRGFESYYVVPADTEDPKQGHWEKGPGLELFDAVKRELGERRFIAEDLGYLTHEVWDMMAQIGYPGMKVLQFAFDTGEENVYLPFNYDTDNAVVYTGTHDNDTTMGWYEKAEDWKQKFVSWYLREKSDITPARKAELFDVPAADGGPAADGDHAADGTVPVPAPDAILDPQAAVTGLVELAHSSRCEMCIIPMQDYLLLGSEARVNVPGTTKGNWRWQMDADAFTPELAKSIREMTERYNR